METFRSKGPIRIHRFTTAAVLAALLSLACTPSQTAGGVEVATMQKTLIEHVMPSRDYVGKHPPRFEWTGIDGVETYTVTVENEVEVQVFEQQGIMGTTTPWPADLKLEAGTYFWRITGMKGGRMIGDSGRAAFLLREQ